MQGMTSGIRFIAMAAVAILACMPLAAEPLMAGIAVGNISPDTDKYHVPLGGYGARMNAPAQGIHDYTLVKALILNQGDKKVALVTADLLGIPRSLRDEVLAGLADTDINSDNLFLCASHTHASTEMSAMNRKNVFGNKAIGVFDESLLIFTADQIAETIRNAGKEMIEVHAGAGSVALPGLNRNRRHEDQGTDEDMTIIRLDTMDGKPWVVFINYTAHPTYMNEHVMHLSAGWPGYLQRNVEAFLGDGVVCMYANGAEGDVAPRGGDGPSPFAKAEDYGRKLTIPALKLIETIETQPEPEIDFAMHELKLPPATPPPALLESAGPEYGMTEDNIAALLDALCPPTSYLGVLRIGDMCAVSIPGEMATKPGLEIKAALRDAGVNYPVILGLANEWISYILPPEEYDKGGYEPGVSFYGKDLGPVTVKQAIEAGTALARK